MDEFKVPIYLMTGFLESGKTSFLNFTLAQEYFQIDEPTLLILCEEGEEEYDKKVLKKSRTSVEVIDSIEELTTERLVAYDAFYNPGRVIIEYNGMWQVSKLEELTFPSGWGIEQHIVTVDASTFQVYLNNMKSLFMEMVRNADLVLFNRADTELPLANFRRSIKVVNPGAELIFEDEEGEIEDIFDGEMPFDVKAETIEIPNEDYGIWYLDARDHADTYNGKKVSFTGMVLKSREFAKNEFVPGRMAMTCCAEDMTFLGFACVYDKIDLYQERDWVKVTAVVKKEYFADYEGEGPVLYAESVTKAKQPKEPVISFT